ncbi:MAG: glutamine--fructose-6-phosphate transaminase (isomerizing), partial [Elusimicrobiota bacterium]|nr:glutamine--fructose-6-phosphate transaminase (isomerizing) [Elusimicrobiota bacterium]
MCGIVGYIGEKFVDPVLIVGLERLEYRGYDSCGIATIFDNELSIRKKKGRIKLLDDSLKEAPLGGNIGIGHTRWATHGEPSETNAHPHLDCKGEIAVVHNGIIENYQMLRDKLISEGHIFISETDTEVIPHLIEKYIQDRKIPLEEATRMALKELKGAFSICVISELDKDKIIAARLGSPLIVGIGKGGESENFIASDIPAILPNTRNVLYLKDGEMAVVTKDSVKITDFDGKILPRVPEEVPYEAISVDKGDYEFFMLKEIHEQPQIIDNLLLHRIKDNFIISFAEMNLDNRYLSRVRKIIIQACGTSWHAGLVAKYWLEKYAHIHTEVDVSSEFRYRNPIAEGDTLMLAISQSGETADTLAGIRKGKSKFIKVLSVVNVVQSTIARESDGIIPIMAGPEIGVA